MSAKAAKITYWLLTILLVLFIIMDGLGGVTKQTDGVVVMEHLGYPIYLMFVLGIAKLFAAIAIIQNKYKIIKEWTFAGIIFTFIGAFVSRAFVGDRIELILPVTFFVFAMVVYYFWKKFNQLKPTESNQSL